MATYSQHNNEFGQEQSQPFESRRPHGNGNFGPGKTTLMSAQHIRDSNEAKSADEVSVKEREKRAHRLLGWWVEIGNLFLSTALFITILVVLKHYNGKVLPKWQFGFNLNALVAVLATFLRTTMMDAVTKLMSQLKWNWFSRPHKLSHLEAIDESTRGPWAAFTLVFLLRRPHPLLLGGAITVLSLALGLFTQQAITSVPCVVPIESVNATLLIQRTMSGLTTYRVAAGTYELDSATKSTMLSALGGVSSQVTVNCPSGNCTFLAPYGISYSSVGLCTKCVESTSKISRVPAQDSFNYTLPNNDTIGGADFNEPVYMAVSYQKDASLYVPDIPPWLGGLDSSLASLNVSNLGYGSVLTFTGVNCTVEQESFYSGAPKEPTLKCPSAGNDTEHNAVSTSCQFYPCIKNYQAHVQNGVLDERPVSTSSMVNIGAILSTDYVGVAIPCLINGTNYDFTNFSMLGPDIPRLITESKSQPNNTIPLECVYTMDFAYSQGIRAFFSDFLTGIGRYNRRQGKLEGRPIITFPEKWWLNNFYNNGLATHESITEAFENIATVLTNYQRVARPEYLARYKAQNMTEQLSPSTVLGLVQTTSICTQFNWPWLLFPACLLIATLALFLMTAVVRHFDGRDLPIWKSSLFPLLFYGLSRRDANTVTEYNGIDPELSERQEKLLDGSELTKIAARTTVRFRRTGNGGGLEEIHRQ